MLVPRTKPCMCAAHLPKTDCPCGSPEEESVDGSLLRLFCPKEVTLMVPTREETL